MQPKQFARSTSAFPRLAGSLGKAKAIRKSQEASCFQRMVRLYRTQSFFIIFIGFYANKKYLGTFCVKSAENGVGKVSTKFLGENDERMWVIQGNGENGGEARDFGNSGTRQNKLRGQGREESKVYNLQRFKPLIGAEPVAEVHR